MPTPIVQFGTSRFLLAHVALFVSQALQRGAEGQALGGQPLLVNAELVGQYGQRQIADSIRFVQTSILQPGLADDAFDVVIARNVLHHLIGHNLRQARQNQGYVFGELLRVTRPGGLIVYCTCSLEPEEGEAAVAFSLFATTMDDLLAVSDAGEMMPPT